MEQALTGKRQRKSTEKNSDLQIQSNKQQRSSLTTVRSTAVVETKILPSVALSLYDKASQLTLSSDQLICYGCEGGYRMTRATHGVHRGAYLWEVEILPSEGENAHVRVGWSTRQGELQSSVGFDQYSYGYRDLEGIYSASYEGIPNKISGSRVHQSQRIDDYGEPYGPGDIIGCYINLDDNNELNKIIFYKNGVDQGVAYSGEEIPPGVYFPAISVYMRVRNLCFFLTRSFTVHI